MSKILFLNDSISSSNFTLSKLFNAWKEKFFENEYCCLLFIMAIDYLRTTTIKEEKREII